MVMSKDGKLYIQLKVQGEVKVFRPEDIPVIGC